MEEKALGNPRETNLKVWKWLERWLAVVRLAQDHETLPSWIRGVFKTIWMCDVSGNMAGETLPSWIRGVFKIVIPLVSY